MLAAAAERAKKPGQVNKETDVMHGARGMRVAGGHQRREACLCTMVVLDRLGQVRKSGGTNFVMLYLCFVTKVDGDPEAGWYQFSWNFQFLVMKSQRTRNGLCSSYRLKWGL